MNRSHCHGYLLLERGIPIVRWLIQLGKNVFCQTPHGGDQDLDFLCGHLDDGTVNCFSISMNDVVACLDSFEQLRQVGAKSTSNTPRYKALTLSSWCQLILKRFA